MIYNFKTVLKTYNNERNTINSFQYYLYFQLNDCLLKKINSIKYWILTELFKITDEVVVKIQIKSQCFNKNWI